MLLTLLLLTALSLTLSLFFTPAIRMLAIRCNLVDIPDNKRKVHTKPIPRVGGVALAAAYFGALLAAAAFLAYQQPNAIAGFATVKSIAPAAFVIFLIGLADDIFNLKATHKFAVQIVAASMVVAAGVHLHGIWMFDTYPVAGAIGTVIWLVACTNAVNLIDGLDGLAAGIAFLATMTIFIGSIISGNMGLTIATAPLAGALLGFLVFNFNPASIFLGDSGSLLLGFLLGCYGTLWSDTAASTLAVVAPLMALAVPLTDTTLAIARRLLRGESPFTADRSHVHHRLLARGISHRNTVLFMYAAAGLAGALSLCLMGASGGPLQSVVIAVFACSVVLGIRQLGYVEFGVARNVILHSSLRREITTQLAVRTFEARLEAARSGDDYWEAIQGRCEQFGLHVIRMKLAGHMFNGQGASVPGQSRTMRMPIFESDWIELSQTPSAIGYPAEIVPFMNTIHRALTDKSAPVPEVRKTRAAFTAPLFKVAKSAAN